MTFRGFDLDQLTTFTGTLDTLATHAGGLHTQLSALLNGAQQNLPAGQRASSDTDLQQLVTVVPGLTTSPLGPATASTTLMPGRLTAELGGMRADIKRRLVQLEGVKAFESAGYPVDDASAFLDEAPPDGGKVDAALKALHSLKGTDFGFNGDTDDLKKLSGTLTGLTGAELDAVISKAASADLGYFGQLINQHGDSGWNPFDSNGLSTTDRDSTLDTLLSRIGPENFTKFLGAFPSVQPIFTDSQAYKDGDNKQNGTNTSGIQWQLPTEPLFNGPVSVDDINQNGMYDCWYIASLSAAAQRDPKFIQEGIKQNPNGTVSVRVWDQQGNFRWVTVTPDLLYANGNPVSADGNGDTWPGYYEKAFALAFGDKGYGGIDNNNPGKAFPYLTGHTGGDITTGGFLGFGKHADKSIPDLKKTFESGKAITVLTPDDDNLEKNLPDHMKQSYCTDHAYYVRGFTADGKIVLGNPWGTSGYPPLTLTQDEFDTYFIEPQEFEVP